MEVMDLLKFVIRKFIKDRFFKKMFNFSFDGQNYRMIESSKYVHYRTLGLANYKNEALTTGCEYGSCDRKTEILNMETMKWSEGPDYPFGSG